MRRNLLFSPLTSSCAATPRFECESAARGFPPCASPILDPLDPTSVTPASAAASTPSPPPLHPLGVGAAAPMAPHAAHDADALADVLTALRFEARRVDRLAAALDAVNGSSEAVLAEC